MNANRTVGMPAERGTGEGRDRRPGVVIRGVRAWPIGEEDREHTSNTEPAGRPTDAVTVHPNTG